jgi:hypothetical protein
MKNKGTITDVGMAAYRLQTIDKYEKHFKKYPNDFKLRCSISGEVIEIPLTDVIKSEIKNFLKEKRALNQKILDDNPKIVKLLEEDKY